MVSLISPSNPKKRRREASPILPIEMVEEIICRFPVKFLLQLRCVCKSWNSLINDPKFARRHLRRSNRRILLVRYKEPSLPDIHHFISYPLPSVLKAVTTGGTQLDYNPLYYGYFVIGSCDGIICCATFGIQVSSFLLWNPSLKKGWELPPLETPLLEDLDHITALRKYGFGYDHLSASFKVVVIFYYRHNAGGYKTHVMVHTVGSNSWRRIGDFPAFPHRPYCHGKFVRGTVNWLACDSDSNCKSIISLDLANESYKELLLPVYGVNKFSMAIMRGCLCIIANLDVWIMKEYGNNRSWTKLFSFSYEVWQSNFPCHALCVCEEDDESLFKTDQNLGIYNHKNGTFRFSDIETKSGLIKDMPLKITCLYVENESLICPVPSTPS